MVGPAVRRRNDHGLPVRRPRHRFGQLRPRPRAARSSLGRGVGRVPAQGKTLRWRRVHLLRLRNVSTYARPPVQLWHP